MQSTKKYIFIFLATLYINETNATKDVGIAKNISTFG